MPDTAFRRKLGVWAQITCPPNPNRDLGNSLTAQQQVGRGFFFGNKSDTFCNCNGCHVLDPNGNRRLPGVKHPGFFGADGRFSFEGESQFFKVPHLRNLYQKAGLFGMAPNSLFPSSPAAPPGSLVFFPLANTPDGETTYTRTPPGSGLRIGSGHDEDDNHGGGDRDARGN